MASGPMGDLEWRTEQVLLDVPEHASTVTYGVSLHGGGQVWIDNVRIEVVSEQIPADANEGIINPYGIRAEPSELTGDLRNADFELEIGEPCS
jgi:hypothetical protein